MENKKLIEAALAIKKYCDNGSIDDDGFCVDSKENKCPFQNEYGKCLFCSGEPCTWKVKKPRRFTDVDVCLAKSAKELGCVYISRFGDEIVASSTNDNILNVKCQSLSNTTVFKSIKVGETVLIDDIIKDEEDWF